MKQRYEILYKNNEFLQEFIGRELWLDQVNGKNKIDGKILNHSRTYTDIMHRILREHWKNCDVPVSPHKVLIWSTDKNCKITQISASHMIYDNKKKIVFSDLINQNMGIMLGHSFYFGAQGNVTLKDNINSSQTTTVTGLVGGTNAWINAGVNFFKVGLGARSGNLRIAYDIQTPAVSLPESGNLAPSGDGAFNPTSGLLSQGLSYSSGGNESLTEIGTYKTFYNTANTQFICLWAYDLISFSTVIAQVVNISSSIQL